MYLSSFQLFSGWRALAFKFSRSHDQVVSSHCHFGCVVKFEIVPLRWNVSVVSEHLPCFSSKGASFAINSYSSKRHSKRKVIKKHLASLRRFTAPIAIYVPTPFYILTNTLQYYIKLSYLPTSPQ